MEIKLIAAPIGQEAYIDYIEEQLNLMDPLYVMINLNQLVKDNFSDKQILELVASLGRGTQNQLHIMQPKDNEFYYTDEWLASLYCAWNTLGRVYWWFPSKVHRGEKGSS